MALDLCPICSEFCDAAVPTCPACGCERAPVQTRLARHDRVKRLVDQVFDWGLAGLGLLYIAVIADIWPSFFYS